MWDLQSENVQKMYRKPHILIPNVLSDSTSTTYCDPGGGGGGGVEEDYRRWRWGWGGYAVPAFTNRSNQAFPPSFPQNFPTDAATILTPPCTDSNRRAIPWCAQHGTIEAQHPGHVRATARSPGVRSANRHCRPAPGVVHSERWKAERDAGRRRPGWGLWAAHRAQAPGRRHRPGSRKCGGCRQHVERLVRRCRRRCHDHLLDGQVQLVGSVGWLPLFLLPPPPTPTSFWPILPLRGASGGAFGDPSWTGFGLRAGNMTPGMTAAASKSLI